MAAGTGKHRRTSWCGWAVAPHHPAKGADLTHQPGDRLTDHAAMMLSFAVVSGFHKQS